MLWRVFLVGINCNKQKFSVLCDEASIRENEENLRLATQTVVCESTASVSSKRLLETQNLRPNPRIRICVLPTSSSDAKHLI